MELELEMEFKCRYDVIVCIWIINRILWIAGGNVEWAQETEIGRSWRATLFLHFSHCVATLSQLPISIQIKYRAVDLLHGAAAPSGLTSDLANCNCQLQFEIIQNIWININFLKLKFQIPIWNEIESKF